MFERIFYLATAAFWAYGSQLLLRQMLPPSASELPKMIAALWMPSLFLALAALLPHRGLPGFLARAMAVLTGAGALVSISMLWGVWFLGMFLQGFQGGWPLLFLIAPLVLLAGTVVAAISAIVHGMRGPASGAAPSAPSTLPNRPPPEAPRRTSASLGRFWWPRQMAAVLVLLSVAWSLRVLAHGTLLRDAWGSIALWWVIGAAALQVLAAIALWRQQRWGWTITLLLQAAVPLLGLLSSARAIGEPGWWLRQMPALLIIALLLLPESRRSRAALREPGYEPGDTVPVSSTVR